MKILYHKNFRRNFRKRIHPSPKLVSQFKKRLEIFLKDPKNPALRNHKLIGKKSEYRAFAITGDIRVVYKKFNNTLLLYDIRTHSQVY